MSYSENLAASLNRIHPNINYLQIGVVIPYNIKLDFQVKNYYTHFVYATIFSFNFDLFKEYMMTVVYNYLAKSKPR